MVTGRSWQGCEGRTDQAAEEQESSQGAQREAGSEEAQGIVTSTETTAVTGEEAGGEGLGVNPGSGDWRATSVARECDGGEEATWNEVGRVASGDGMVQGNGQAAGLGHVSREEAGRGSGFDAADAVCPFEQLGWWLADRERRPESSMAMDPGTWFVLCAGHECAFWPSQKFVGRWPGMAFKTGAQGTGYYVDVGPAKYVERGGRRGIPLCLDRLVGRGGAGDEACLESERTSRCRRRRRRRQKRISGAPTARVAVLRLGDGTGCGGENSPGGSDESASNGDGERDVGECGGSESSVESGGSARDSGDNEDEAEGGSVSSVEEESSIDSDDCAGWAEAVGEEERQETAGGRRQWWLFDTVNPNAWGAGEMGGGGLQYLQRTGADVVGIQEMRVVGHDRCNAAMQAAKKAKWKMKVVQAHVTEKGYASAGVAVACRSHVGMCHPRVQGWEYDGTRIHHSHIGAVCRGGIHCFSIYLYNSEGLTDRNRALLLDIARLLRGIRGPWVVMGDWNLAPEVLQAAGWVEEVCGKIICPSVPTCKKSVIDYFVIDRRLLQAVKYVKRMEGFGITPHYPVRMAIMALPRRMTVRRLVAPQKVPAVLPQGCLTEKECEESEAREWAAAREGRAGGGRSGWSVGLARWKS